MMKTKREPESLLSLWREFDPRRRQHSIEQRRAKILQHSTHANLTLESAQQSF